MNTRSVLVWCLLGSAAAVFTPVLEVEQGKLRGLRSVFGQNRYFGIPYATSNRFKRAEPPAAWGGTFDAVFPFESCAQTVASIRLGREDCLRLDIYTPETPSSTPLPVYVFFHGGGYYYGTKWNYDPDFLVTNNIIAVVVNYRLGIFGFLCFDGISNLGLKDQAEALKWIKRNIAAFGGDPDNVTISGQSAGAAAAAMHMLSKSSAGLFHKLILFSGNPISPWAFNVEKTKPALEDARKLGDANTEKEALEVFSTSTVEDILSATADTSINPRYFKYAPCEDSNLTDPFFHDTPFATITSGKFSKVPIISGYTSAEGALFFGLHDDKTLKEFDDNFSEKLPSVFSWCSANKDEIAEKFRARYFGKMEINREAKKGIVDFYSDWLVYSTADAFARLMSEYSDQPLYEYIFDYEGDRNFAKLLFGRGVTGASHSDDVFYVFKPAGAPLLLSSRDKLFIERLTAMLTNFMKFGNPTPRRSRLLPAAWPASTSNRSVSMLLAESPRVVATPQRRFFLKILCEYGQQGHVPCESRMTCGV